MANSTTLEVPVDSLEAARIAAPFADRLELCDDLSSEGWSPTVELVRAVRNAVDIERTALVAMIRPRVVGAPTSLDVAGFTATPAIVDASLREIDRFAEAGATSVAIGVLTPEGHVDVDACRRMRDVALGHGMVVAFLRTFDLLVDRAHGMRAITELGLTRVVTAGVLGWNAAVRSIEERVTVLADDARVASEAAAPLGQRPVEVVPGGGVRAANAPLFLRASPHLHASCRPARGKAGVIDRDELTALRAVLDRA